MRPSLYELSRKADAVGISPFRIVVAANRRKVLQRALRLRLRMTSLL